MNRARAFNYIAVDENRGILRKYSEDKDKFVGEIQWYLKLPADLSYARPRIFSHSADRREPYIEMEYYAYHTVHEFFLYGDVSQRQWRRIFERIRFLCRDFRRYQVQGEGIRPSLESMYLTKTLQRLERIRTDRQFAPFFQREITINGRRYHSLEQIGEFLKEQIPRLLYDVETFSIIHGDLCFTNILVDADFSLVKVVDPRGNFGRFDIYGDPRYELAKLLHSFDGKYDYIVKDLFHIAVNAEQAQIDYVIPRRGGGRDLYPIFLEVFAEEIGPDLRKIEMIEALLFLSMIPLHREDRDHQMAMLAVGIEILDRVIDVRL